MVFETERLILRPLEENDAEACYQYVSDPQISSAAGWPAHTSVDNSRQIIQEVLRQPENYAIVLKETGQVIGSVHLMTAPLARLTERKDECQLEYWIGTPFWGQGIIVEASLPLLRHAFEDLNYRRVWCGYYEGNQRSRRVQEKLGFQYVWTRNFVYIPALNETREEHVSCLTRLDWLRSNSISA